MSSPYLDGQRVIRVNQHRGYVQNAHGDEFFAVCMSCGPLSTPNRSTEASAQADVDRHVASSGHELRVGGGA